MGEEYVQRAEKEKKNIHFIPVVLQKWFCKTLASPEIFEL